MTTSDTQTTAAVITPYWRRSLVLLVLGVVALLANTDFTQHQQIQKSFLGESGQVESFPRADLALLLHKDLPLQRLLLPAIASGDDSEKKSPVWLSLAGIDQAIFNLRSNPRLTAFAVVYYASPRIRNHSPRAPPRS